MEFGSVDFRDERVDYRESALCLAGDDGGMRGAASAPASGKGRGGHRGGNETAAHLRRRGADRPGSDRGEQRAVLLFVGLRAVRSSTLDHGVAGAENPD